MSTNTSAELVALQRVRDKLVKMGAKLPIEVNGTIESAMNSGHSHALLLVEEEIADLSASPQVPQQEQTEGTAAGLFDRDDMIAYGRLCWRQSRETWPSDVEPMPAIEARFDPVATPQPSQPADSGQALRPTDDELWDQTLRERDSYREWADRLADAIAKHTGVDIGEHSSANFPWEEAIEALVSTPQAAQPADVGSDSTPPAAPVEQDDSARMRSLAERAVKALGDLSFECDGVNSTFEELQKLRTELALRAPRGGQEVAKALEFAEHIAKCADCLLEQLNAEDSAREKADSTHMPADFDALGEAQEGRCEYASALRAAIYEFRKRASKVPSAPQPSAVKAPEGWISVEERLPEPDTGEVLVWLTGGRCAFDEWHMYREDPTGMGGPTMEMGLMWRDYDYDEITHWQPLPAAPSAQGDEPSTTPGAKA